MKFEIEGDPIEGDEQGLDSIPAPCTCPQVTCEEAACKTENCHEIHIRHSVGFGRKCSACIDKKELIFLMDQRGKKIDVYRGT